MTQLNESMEFNSPQPFFGVTTNQLSYFIGSFWSTKDTPDGLKPYSRHPTPHPIQAREWERRVHNQDVVSALEMSCAHA